MSVINSSLTYLNKQLLSVQSTSVDNNIYTFQKWATASEVSQSAFQLHMYHPAYIGCTTPTFRHAKYDRRHSVKFDRQRSSHCGYPKPTWGCQACGSSSNSREHGRTKATSRNQRQYQKMIESYNLN